VVVIDQLVIVDCYWLVLLNWTIVWPSWTGPDRPSGNWMTQLWTVTIGPDPNDRPSIVNCWWRQARTPAQLDWPIEPDWPQPRRAVVIDPAQTGQLTVLLIVTDPLVKRAQAMTSIGHWYYWLLTQTDWLTDPDPRRTAQLLKDPVSQLTMTDWPDELNHWMTQTLLLIIDGAQLLLLLIIIGIIGQPRQLLLANYCWLLLLLASDDNDPMANIIIIVDNWARTVKDPMDSDDPDPGRPRPRRPRLLKMTHWTQLWRPSIGRDPGQWPGPGQTVTVTRTDGKFDPAQTDSWRNDGNWPSPDPGCEPVDSQPNDPDSQTPLTQWAVDPLLLLWRDPIYYWTQTQWPNWRTHYWTQANVNDPVLLLIIVIDCGVNDGNIELDNDIIGPSDPIDPDWCEGNCGVVDDNDRQLKTANDQLTSDPGGRANWRWPMTQTKARRTVIDYWYWRPRRTVLWPSDQPMTKAQWRIDPMTQASRRTQWTTGQWLLNWTGQLRRYWQLMTGRSEGAGRTLLLNGG